MAVAPSLLADTTDLAAEMARVRALDLPEGGLHFADNPPCEAPIEHATYDARCGECKACREALLGIRIGDRTLDVPAWGVKYLRRPTADAAGAAFDPIAWKRAWDDYAPCEHGGARPTLTLIDEIDQRGSAGLLTEEEALAELGVCGHEVAETWPAGVACPACLADHLPEAYLRAAFVPPEILVRADETIIRPDKPGQSLLTSGLEEHVGRPLPSAARLAPLPWLTNDLGFPIITAATLVDAVAEALEGDRAEDARARARLVLDDEAEAARLVDLILDGAVFVASAAPEATA